MTDERTMRVSSAERAAPSVTAGRIVASQYDGPTPAAPEPHGEDVDQERPDDEARHADADEGDDGSALSATRALRLPAMDAQRHGYQDGDDERGERELDRSRVSFEDEPSTSRSVRNDRPRSRAARRPVNHVAVRPAVPAKLARASAFFEKVKRGGLVKPRASRGTARPARPWPARRGSPRRVARHEFDQQRHQSPTVHTTSSKIRTRRATSSLVLISGVGQPGLISEEYWRDG